MRTSRIAMLITGCLSTLVGLALLTASGFVLWGYLLQRDGGEITLPEENFTTSSNALVSEDISMFDSAHRSSMLGLDDLGTISLRVTSIEPRQRVFVGIGPTAQVDNYLAGVAHTVVNDVDFDPFRVSYDQVAGADTAAPPTLQPLWSSQVSGLGEQRLSWDLQNGSWTVVIMNADGSPGVSVDIQPGVHFDFLGPLAVALLAATAVFLLIGVPLIVIGAVGLGRHEQPGGVGATTDERSPDDVPAASNRNPVYPATLTGHLEEGLSRWLWVVKWVLAIPHYVVLFFLGMAFVVTTVVAGFAILFTGKYPRRIFEFNVGALRWLWRVQFYTYSALGTDRYPPFTLRSTDYPADFAVEYPETLSRGLVLVKWWLLAIPHYLILAILAGGWYAGFRIASDDGDLGSAGQPWFFSSVLGLLVIVAGCSLLFANRYPRGLFDLVMGINRWAFRVAAYAALMRDEYPPMRLDQGDDEPRPIKKLSADAEAPLQPVSTVPSGSGAPVQPPHPRDWFNG